MIANGQLLAALPVAVYVTDAEGTLTFYNEAAAALWGHRPELGTSRWCGSWRLYWPDGRPMSHDGCLMATALNEGRELRGEEAVAERPNGVRVPLILYSSVSRDSAGKVVGSINVLVDVGKGKNAEIESAQLAAIVSSSDDAIISKTLKGRITSWNAGAKRIFGYEAEEMIGESIARIIPADRSDEENLILAKIHRGERVDHFDTVRVAKDGRRVDISVTISPLRDFSGNIVGAAKVARDITERKRTEALQQLLFDELNHRVKNMLATIQAIATQSLRRSARPEDFVSSFTGRVQALAKAHDLLVNGKLKGTDVAEILREQVALGTTDGTRVSCKGPLVVLGPRAAMQLALVVHELATNARKYGALSVPTGTLTISWEVVAGGHSKLLLNWKEQGVPNVRVPTTRGFGTTLIERSFEAYGGETSLQFGADGLICDLTLPLTDEDQNSFSTRIASIERGGRRGPDTAPATWSSLIGLRVLVVEDEALVGMEIESRLTQAGCQVVGVAGNVADARRLIEDTAFDAAVVDANLNGHPVDEIAAALVRKRVPFAFATGYERSALPQGFGDVPVLRKPFTGEQLISVVEALATRHQRWPAIAVLRPP